MSIKQKVRIEVLGKIWWPIGALAATTLNLKLGTGPFEVDIDPTVGNIEDYLGSHAGDFSEIVDWRAELTTIDRRVEDDRVVTTYTKNLIKDWTEPDHEYDFNDCFPEYA